MTPFEFDCAYTHWLKKGYENLQNIRFLSYHIVNVQSSKPYEKSITEWMPLATDPHEEIEKNKPLTPEEIEAIKQKYASK